jgi:Zn ribbon nucleic-acid-binding protein
MSNFIAHIPCPKCNSKDNLAEYDDHFFCFGCKYTKKKEDVNSTRLRALQRDKDKEESVNMLENVREIPKKAMQWLLTFGITQAEIEEYGIKWNPRNEFLVLIDQAKYWQARTFDGRRPKYMSFGRKPLTIFGEGDTIVIVEDILSAMKIARLRGEFCSAPVLGSSLAYDMEEQVVGQYKKALIWLDRDKARNSLLISRKLKERGLDSKIVVTELDPKLYSKNQIKKYLEERC